MGRSGERGAESGTGLPGCPQTGCPRVSHGRQDLHSQVVEEGGLDNWALNHGFEHNPCKFNFSSSIYETKICFTVSTALLWPLFNFDL